MGTHHPQPLGSYTACNWHSNLRMRFLLKTIMFRGYVLVLGSVIGRYSFCIRSFWHGVTALQTFHKKIDVFEKLSPHTILPMCPEPPALPFFRWDFFLGFTGFTPKSTWKWSPGKGDLFSKVSFSGFMLGSVWLVLSKAGNGMHSSSPIFSVAKTDLSKR